MKQVPVWFCGKVVAYAMVDNTDYKAVMQYTWLADRYYASCRNVKLHEFIMGSPAPQGFVWDHIDGNGLNCQRSNLRLATKAQNNRNVNRRNSTGYLGVATDGRRFWGRVSVKVAGKYKWLFNEVYTTAEDAARGRDEFYRGSPDHKEYVRYNFPRIGERGLDGKVRKK